MNSMKGGPTRAIDKYYLFNKIGEGQFGEVFISCPKQAYEDSIHQGAITETQVYACKRMSTVPKPDEDEDEHIENLETIE